MALEKVRGCLSMGILLVIPIKGFDKIGVIISLKNKNLKER